MGEFPRAPPTAVASTTPAQQNSQSSAQASMLAARDYGLASDTRVALDKSEHIPVDSHPMVLDDQIVRHPVTTSLVTTSPANIDSSGNSRDARVKILDEIVTSLERKKPHWDKTRILHLSIQLEESMYDTTSSLAAYEDLSTLSARINRHCLVLAKRKQTTGEDNRRAAEYARGRIARGGLPAHSQPQPVGKIPLPANACACGNPKISESSQFPNSSGAVIRKEGPQAFDPGGLDDEMEVISVSGATSAVALEGSRPAQRGRSLSVEVLLPPPAEEARWDATSPQSTEQPFNARLEESVSSPPGYNLCRTRDSSTQTSSDSARTQSIANKRPHSRVAEKVPDLKDERTHAEDAMTADTKGYDGGVRTMSVEERGRRVSSCASSGSSGRASIVTVSSRASSQDGDDDGAACIYRGGCDTEDMEEMKQRALRLLQCRLLLLSHAAGCKEDEGACQLSPLCDSVRQLLHHMQDCNDTKTACQFPHCTSSTALLQHQRMCTNAGCSLCASVRELAQKCFWASARHAHKRRLQESHELRRKKRQSEGKMVPPPRKPQAERPKTARELCSGLDEAGNDLGDITLGFFLRQDKAVKARKLSEGKPGSECDTQDASSTGKSHQTTDAIGVDEDRPSVGNTNPILPSAPNQNNHDERHQLAGASGSAVCSAPDGKSFRAAASSAAQNTAVAVQGTIDSVALCLSASLVSPTLPGRTRPAMTNTITSAISDVACADNAQINGVNFGKLTGAATTGARFETHSETVMHQESPSSTGVSSLRGGHVEFVATSHPFEMNIANNSPTGSASAENSHVRSGSQKKGEDMTGGGAEAHVVGISSGEEREPLANGGGHTVVIPPAGKVGGSLKTAPEMLLDEIAESLKDTRRQPSFANIQSVQAFLNEHGELSESPSFGDACALVGQWTSIDDGPGEDDQLGMSSAFSF